MSYIYIYTLTPSDHVIVFYCKNCCFPLSGMKTHFMTYATMRNKHVNTYIHIHFYTCTCIHVCVLEYTVVLSTHYLKSSNVHVRRMSESPVYFLVYKVGSYARLVVHCISHVNYNKYCRNWNIGLDACIPTGRKYTLVRVDEFVFESKSKIHGSVTKIFTHVVYTRAI